MNLLLDIYKNKLQGDKKLWMVAFGLSIISLLAVFSSVSSLAVKHHGGNPSSYVIKHLVFLGIGFFIMHVVSKAKISLIARLGNLSYWFALALLLYTLINGVSLNSASRWINIPIINQSFQTSDLAKIVVVLFLSRFLAARQGEIKNYKTVFIPALGYTLGVVILILPANFSTAAMLFMVCLSVLFVARIPIHQILLGLSVLGVLGFGGLKIGAQFLPRLSTWESRIQNFGADDAEGNYQADHAKIAIASGGIIPKGPGNGVSRNFLPHPYSDMIYAFIIEEYGSILGGLLIIFLYLFFLIRCIKIASKTEHAFVAYASVGLGVLICTQAFINMGVSVGMFPVTGQPLPLVSLGGTSTIFTCLIFGVLLAFSRDNHKTEMSNG